MPPSSTLLDERRDERPTIPVPRESGIQLRMTKVLYAAATVDVVLCDRSRDPRSEDYLPEGERPGRLERRLFLVPRG